MKQSGFVLIVALLLTAACDTPQMSGDASLDSRMDSVSYTYGFFIGSSLADEGVEDIDIQNLAAGVMHALEQNDRQLSEMEMANVIQAFQQEMQLQRMRQQEDAAGENIQAGIDFLAENIQREGVQETESGLQYEVIEAGSGDTPGPNQRVRVHYEGSLIDGTIFDSSHQRGEPATFGVDQVIRGWTEGLQLMEEGATYKFYIPSDLAYGTQQRGEHIQPGSLLIFEVELLEVLD
ncbi:MAG: FKBP-type peptidyl-prolyl cis-trans isomerase [Balneolaceae bacterium]